MSCSLLLFGRRLDARSWHVLRDSQVASLLLAFNGSFAITNLIMLYAVARRFGTRIVIDPKLKERVTNNWELPAAGLPMLWDYGSTRSSCGIPRLPAACS